MARKENISQDLYDLLVSRGWEPESTDAQGQPSQPQEATIFTFDYVSTSGQNYGTAVAVLDDDGDLQLFYGDNLGRGMEEQDKNEWFGFLQQMKQFATRHDFHTFSPRNLNQLKHTMAGMAAIREGLFESYYGNRTVSYSGEPTQARLMIRHRKPLGETDARYRYVESLFVETAEGERWKLPFRMLAGGRAMLEHVRQGGRPYDVRGVHISQMVEEINVLSRFRRATQGRVVEGVAQGLVEQATQYLESARGTLKNLGSSRGYQTYFESWSPADIADTEALVEEVKGLFVETTLDARIEAALPILSRLQGNTMREADIFESWIERLAEGTWSTPDTPEAKKKLEQLMSQELPVGPDATNAIEQLYDIFGDDDLFDRLQALAERDPDADARFEIHSRAQEMGIDLPEPPIPEPAQQDLTRQPAPGQQDTEQVDEEDSDVKTKCADLGQLRQDPMAMRDPQTRAEVLRRSHELGCDQLVKEEHDTDDALEVIRKVRDQIASMRPEDVKILTRELDIIRSDLMKDDWTSAQQYWDALAATKPDRYDFLYDLFAEHGWEWRAQLAEQGVAEAQERVDMTDKKCTKCKKGQYQERSVHDDWEGKVTCQCGHRVDRWQTPKKKGVAEGDKQTPGIALSKPYEKDFTGKYPGGTLPAATKGKTPGIALSKAYKKDFTGKYPGGELEEGDQPTGKYRVFLIGNWYNGKWFDYGGRPVTVPGNTPQEALDWVAAHKDDIINYYKTARIAGTKRRLLPRDVENNLWLDKTHAYKPAPADANFARFVKPDVEEGDNLATFVGPNEDSTDAMDHRGAVTDSFYEDLARIKSLALSK